MQVGSFERAEAMAPGHTLAADSVKPELMDSALPALGPLGNYLMARWKSRMAAQQVYHPAFREAQL